MNPFARLHSLRRENDAAGAIMAGLRPRFERIAGRHENGTAPRAVVVYQLFQTPPPLAARLVSLLGLKPGARVLEPSSGLGRILDALKAYTPGEVVAVEIAADCCAELYQQERQGVTIKQRDFLSIDPAELGTFDAIAMNPPFHNRADILHIEHARKFLKPGGILGAICMAGPKREDRLRPIARHWEPIEARAFKDTGTQVDTVLLTIHG